MLDISREMNVTPFSLIEVSQRVNYIFLPQSCFSLPTVKLVDDFNGSVAFATASLASTLPTSYFVVETKKWFTIRCNVTIAWICRIDWISSFRRKWNNAALLSIHRWSVNAWSVDFERTKICSSSSNLCLVLFLTIPVTSLFFLLYSIKSSHSCSK